MSKQLKQIIVVNEALSLPRGKLAAQVAHASVAGFLAADGEAKKNWLDVGMPKVVLSASGENEVTALYQQAMEAKLPTYVISDAGKTVVEPGTITCVVIGPAVIEEIDKITGHLRLLTD